MDDRIVAGLALNVGEGDVGGVGDEEARAMNGWQLGGVAEHQDRFAERQQILAQSFIDHRAFVDDEQLGLGERRAVGQFELRAVFGFGAGIDQRVQGGCVLAAFGAHDVRGLAGEGSEDDAAVNVLG